jgi:hypothetical protein
VLIAAGNWSKHKAIRFNASALDSSMITGALAMKDMRDAAK